MSDEGEIDVESDDVAEGGDGEEETSGKVRYTIHTINDSPNLPGSRLICLTRLSKSPSDKRSFIKWQWIVFADWTYFSGCVVIFF